MADHVPARRIPAPYAPSLLVVDDDEQQRSIVRRILEDAGYFVHEAATSRSALSIIDDRYIDLAIIDLSMPDMDGIELLQELRKQSPQLKILVISGFMYGMMLPIAEKLGAAAAISKSVAEAEILRTVCKVLGQRTQ